MEVWLRGRWRRSEGGGIRVWLICVHSFREAFSGVLSEDAEEELNLSAVDGERERRSAGERERERRSVGGGGWCRAEWGRRGGGGGGGRGGRRRWIRACEGEGGLECQNCRTDRVESE